MSSIEHAALSAYATEAGGTRQLVAWSALSPRSLMLVMGEKERRDRFGYALDQALTRRDMSNRQLGTALGIDPRKIAKWRKGDGLPDYYQTQEIAEALRVSEDLFRNPPAVPKPPAYPLEKYLLDAGAKGLAQGLSDEPPDDAAAAEPDAPQA